MKDDVLSLLYRHALESSLMYHKWSRAECTLHIQSSKVKYGVPSVLRLLVLEKGFRWMMFSNRIVHGSQSL